MSEQPPDGGALAALQQAYRQNWQRYLATLGDAHAPRGWDICVLTASNRRQAEVYEAQLAARREEGLLPAGTRFLVLPDPDGPRIGSGGATLRVLAELARIDGPHVFSAQRVLAIHSGGDSRRLPHCSATGKLFVRLPHELPDGRASSLLDEFLACLSGLPEQSPPGVLVASGDVLLIFDHLQVSFRRAGIVGLAAAAPAAEGTRHGVYVTDGSSRRVRAYLHKAPLARLAAKGAIDVDGRVQIDTGLVWLDPDAAGRLLCLTAGVNAALARQTALNLYGDLLAPLAEEAERRAYLADTSDGPATADLQETRRRAWEVLRGTPFGVERLHPAEFIHMGTTREYLSVLASASRSPAGLGWQRDAASWVPIQAARAEGTVLANACLRRLDPASGGAATDSAADGPVRLGAGSLLANVVVGEGGLAVEDGVVIHQLPLRESDGWVTRIYGCDDDPKQAVGDGGTFFSQPWGDWLRRAGLVPADLWPASSDPALRTLWEARLYPACAEREESLRAVLWMEHPEEASPDVLARWHASERTSLADAALRADVRCIVDESDWIADRVRARRFVAAAEAERPAREYGTVLGHSPHARRRAQAVGDLLEAALDPWLPIRGYQALAVATGDERWSTRAFAALARQVLAHTPAPETSASALAGLAPGKRATLRAAARLDFGGGWTDTPPYSLERGGTVLNAAVRLRGALPISAEAEVLAVPAIVLESRDTEATVRPRTAGDVLDFANPADPYALLKAAIVFRGLVPPTADPDMLVSDLLAPLGRGLRLSTGTSVPRGSGLGTSSILAGTVLQTLATLLGAPVPIERLFDEVLCMEQMLTTGGGWQDQIGGLTGGIKRIRTRPGLPQVAEIERVALTPALERALPGRLVLFCTGQRRLARNLLRTVMGRWMARDPEMVALLTEIAALADAMHAALRSADLDALGALMGEHWQVNKRMDAGCTNPFVDDVLAFCAPYVVGGKLAGAGGGGFALMVARDAEAAGSLGKALVDRYGSVGAGVWDCSVAREGLCTAEDAP